jgi:SAM-dependent methyltransferase
MPRKPNKIKLPSTLPDQLRNRDKVIEWIAEITQQNPDTVLQRLRQEFDSPGSNVAQAFADTKLTPYLWTNEMQQFYESTDAFLYELIIWNRNRLKRRMRRWVATYFARTSSEPLDILSIGDGLGFDSAYLAKLGHRVTYFEFPGYSESFARKVFADSNTPITVLTDPNNIPHGAFDAVVCLDVLEHVPAPSDFVRRLIDYLRPEGKLLVHAPFFMIHPSNPTHLKANRTFSGKLSLYTDLSLKLIDGEIFWNPLVFQKTSDGSSTPSPLKPSLLALRLTGLYLALGRFSLLPFAWIDSYRKKTNKWFDD